MSRHDVYVCQRCHKAWDTNVLLEVDINDGASEKWCTQCVSTIQHAKEPDVSLQPRRT
jgi:hypothetical protein